MKSEIRTEILSITASKRQSFEADQLLFWNKGSTNVTINHELILAPGEQLSLDSLGGRDNTEFVFTLDRAASPLLIVIARRISQL